MLTAPLTLKIFGIELSDSTYRGICYRAGQEFCTQLNNTLIREVLPRWSERHHSTPSDVFLITLIIKINQKGIINKKLRKE